MLPEKIGRYEIKSELGRGGMATVYHAYDPLFERDVAIKLLPSELLHSDPQYKLRFEREAKIIAKLEHPAIVPVYDVGNEKGQPYFVMRYMSGESLSERIHNKIFTVEEAIAILEQIAPGLDEAHSKGIVHRDLKPANILFTHRGVPLISDFGIAKITQAEGGEMTGSAIIGTPSYMSPEQAAGEPVDGRADIYALGVILYEMVTGSQPYHADTPLAVAIKHMTEPVPRILEANPKLPKWMEHIIFTSMAKNRDDRFKTAVDMVNAIKSYMVGETPTVSIQVEQPTLRRAPYNKTAISRSRKEKRSPWGAIIGLLLVVILIGGGIYFFSGKGTTSTKEPPTEIPIIPQTEVPTEVTATTEVVLTDEPATAEPTEPPVAELPVIGGGDKIVFQRNNDLWLMNLDGSDSKALTTDGVEKFNIEWLADGKSVLFMSGKTVKTVDVESLQENVVFSYISAEYFESFHVSPDMKQAAIALERELYVVPFDVETLQTVNRKSQLNDMKGCLYYNAIPVKDARWSDDGQKLAVEYIAPVRGVFVDSIQILDIHNCNSNSVIPLDNFPGAYFSFSDEIVNFGWDGNLLFFLNNNRRNGGFGDLGFYNSGTHKFTKVAPYEGNCCYRDVSFSPDGTYVVFAFQDIRLGQESPTQLFYIPADSLSTQRKLEPIPMPDDFFRRTDAPMPAVRPVK